MPLRTFKCPESAVCDFELEVLVNASESKEAAIKGELCPFHAKQLVSAGEVESAVLSSGRSTRKGGVVLSNGQRVSGSFPSNRKG